MENVSTVGTIDLSLLNEDFVGPVMNWEREKIRKERNRIAVHINQSPFSERDYIWNLKELPHSLTQKRKMTKEDFMEMYPLEVENVFPKTQKKSRFLQLKEAIQNLFKSNNLTTEEKVLIHSVKEDNNNPSNTQD